MTSKQSFQNLDDWLEEINLDVKGVKTPIALVATKSDLAASQRCVPETYGYNKLKEIGKPRCFLFRETSTYTDNVQPVEDLFKDIAEEIIHRRNINTA